MLKHITHHFVTNLLSKIAYYRINRPTTAVKILHDIENMELCGKLSLATVYGRIERAIVSHKIIISILPLQHDIFHVNYRAGTNFRCR